MTLQFAKSEIEALLHVLDNHIPSLRHEILHTDSREFRKGLQDQEATLLALRDRLSRLQRSDLGEPDYATLRH